MLVAAALLASPAALITVDGTPAQGALLRGTAPVGTSSLTRNGRPVLLAPDGRFLIAFERDAAPAATLVARRGDLVVVRELAVARRAWAIQHIAMAARFQPGG